jgi:FkbM family methyltransferase
VTSRRQPAFERLEALGSVAEWRRGVLAPYAAVLDGMRTAQVFGARRLGAKVAGYMRDAGVSVTAFSDNDETSHGTEVAGTPVVAPAMLDRDVPTVVASQYLHDIGRQLRAAGLTRVVPYPVLSAWDEARFPPESTMAGWAEDLVERADRWRATEDLLADAESRRVLGELLAFRLTLDPAYAYSAASPPERQWFDPSVVSPRTDETLVDGGGYDGETARRFAEATRGSYRRIVVFEPDERLLGRAAATLAGLPRVELKACGLYSEDTDRAFAATGEADGAIVEHGEARVPVVTLDSSVTDPVTFLKLDVEGAEEAALRGAARHIREDRPVIAAAAYHRASDIWRLPEVIDELAPGYRFALRHYSQTSLETVVYALPEG